MALDGKSFVKGALKGFIGGLAVLLLVFLGAQAGVVPQFIDGGSKAIAQVAGGGAFAIFLAEELFLEG